MVRDGERIIAAMPFWVTTQREKASLSPPALLSGVGLGPGRYIVASAQRAYTSQLLLADEASADWAVPLMVDRLRDAARRIDAVGCLVIYARGDQLSYYRHVVPERSPVLMDHDASIPVGGVDDPLPPGMSGHRRARIRREEARFEAAGYRIGRERLADCLDDFARLAVNLERRHGGDLDADTLGGQLGVQVKWCDDEAVVFTARRDERLAAACLCYVSATSIVSRMYGFDDQLSGGSYEYFNLAYYLPLRYAAAHGLSAVEVGRQALDAKRLRGAVVHSLWAVDLSENPLWNEPPPVLHDGIRA
ncbi:GNAT family N-acetyltransferase [Micromonospora sp. DT4]|uniref:GNAT family N-acetyltransferase n=1 Tax=Micromonospora sp. DT4 TaxID=3393438 RepID=UPI003CF54F1F